MHQLVRRINHISSRGLMLVFVLLYIAVLGVLLNLQSLWLDELIDLHQIRDLSLTGLIQHVPLNAGGVPLNYIFRKVIVVIFGFSQFTARLASLIFSVIACAGIYRLGRIAQLNWPMIGLAIFALIPCQIRYAMESRPYSQVLAITIWATIVFCGLYARPCFLNWLIYTSLIACGLYTQPYTVFVPVAHLIWLIAQTSIANRRKMSLMVAAGIVVASIAFLPWFMWTLKVWQSSNAAQQHYLIRWSSGAMIYKELLGAGYVGTSLLVILAAVGYRAHPPPQTAERTPNRQLWLLCMGVPIVLPFIADIYFGYFLATRQTIAAIAPLALLSAQGIERLWGQPAKTLTTIFAGSVLMTFMYASIHFFCKPREDWGRAASDLKDLAEDGTCIIFAPPESSDFYTFYQPGLTKLSCDPLKFSPQIIIARSPYGSQDNYRADIDQMRRLGYVKLAKRSYNGPISEVYARRK